MKLLTQREKGILDEAIAGANVSNPANNVVVHTIGRLYFLYNHLEKAIVDMDLRGTCPFCRCNIGSIPTITDHSDTCMYRKVMEAR